MMQNNLFEMGAHFEDSWVSDNKEKLHKKISTEIKAPHQHRLHFAKEKRRGKVITIVTPFCLEKSTLQALLKTLKKQLGTGGTVKEDSLEFQGDISRHLHIHLEEMGYRFKS